MSIASQALMRKYVNDKPFNDSLNSFIETTLSLNKGSIIWTSPLPDKTRKDGFNKEPTGASLFMALNITADSAFLKAFRVFWPASGSHWDATAYSGNHKLMFEAKAHIDEAVHPSSGTDSSNSSKIDLSLKSTMESLCTKTCYVDWRTSFYQYANRLAHLLFLQKYKYVDSYMIFLYFANNLGYKKHNSVEEWKGAIQLQHHLMGLSSKRLKSKHVLSIIIDCNPQPGAPMFYLL